MRCLTEITSGNYIVASPQPTTNKDCINLIITPTELSDDIFNLSPEQGALLGGAIIAVWAVGFAIKSAISSLNYDFNERHENE